ncbi:MAG TPA: ROK family protein, partial [Planctomycetota bacterium]|nr:ROK family protein [Planctomycetota bacterium]
MSQGPITLCIDIGGSKTKLVRCDARSLPLEAEPVRKDTPANAGPEATLELVIDALPELAGDFDRIAIGYPGVIRDGICATAVNLAPAWHGFPIAAAFAERLGKPARAANDADVQGLGSI